MPRATGSAPLPRRRLLTLPLAAASAALIPLSAPRPASAGTRPAVAPLGDATRRAYHYLDVVHDAYQRGSQPRLLQSYNNESELMTTAFVYDNALAVLAYLAEPTPEHVRRARLVGDALLWAQTHDETHTDGRVRQAYAAGPMRFYGGGPDFDGLRRTDGKAAFLWPYGFGGSATGDMAWAALALTALYRHTRDVRYLDGAVAMGDWIALRRSPYRYGGYHGGVQADGVTAQRWTSTEHNIDAYALFTLLQRLTGDRRWTARAATARAFVHGMWNARQGFFATGTLGGLAGEDPNVVNLGTIPSDVQTWSLLALRDRRYAGAVDWTIRKLGTIDGGAGSQLPAGVRIAGITYSDRAKAATGTVPGSTLPNRRTAVWLEGTGHTALALLVRGGPADRAAAQALLHQITVAQDRVGAGQTVGLTADPAGGRLSDPAAGGTWTGTPLPARCGVVAATSAFDTGFGFGYFQRQHVGATAWFLLAASRRNPFR